MVRTSLTVLFGVLLVAGQLSAAPVVEMEPNGALGAPQTVTAPASITGRITGADIDFYSFTGGAGQLFVFDIDGTPPGSFLGLALFDPAGMLFALSLGSEPEPGSVDIDPFIGLIALPTTGTYTIGVFDYVGTGISFPASGQTQLVRPDGVPDGGVSFAPIPPDIAVGDSGITTDYTLRLSAVPEPTSLVLVLTGILVGGVILRRRPARG